jgi:hypothetical protein
MKTKMSRRNCQQRRGRDRMLEKAMIRYPKPTLTIDLKKTMSTFSRSSTSSHKLAKTNKVFPTQQPIGLFQSGICSWQVRKLFKTG